MNATFDLLRGELEKHFDLDAMKRISADLLGLDPEEVGGTSAKGAFARALVERCAREDGLLALADAVLLSAKNVDDRVKHVFDALPGEELAPGTMVGSYRVVKKLAEGTLGVVYFCEQKEEGGAAQRVALKVIRASWARDRASARRFLTVSRVLRTVRAKGLGPVLDAGVLADGRPWVATPFVEGQTLATRIQRVGAMHFNEARPVLTSVLTALEALHARGIVHGDLKTENVFVVRSGGTDGKPAEVTAVLVDAATDRLLTPGAPRALWSAKATAPELLRGKAPDARSDVYAFGALLYETLSGKPAFTGATPIDVALHALDADPPPPSGVAPKGWLSKELDGVVLKALAKDPGARYQTAGEVREQLESIARQSMRPPSAAGALDETAFDVAAKALAAAPNDEEKAIALERVAEGAGAWERVLAEFGKTVEAATEQEAKIALLFRIARIEEHERKSPKEAEAAYAKILELDPEDEIAQIGIEELRRQSGNHEGLVELLLEKVGKAEAGRDRAAILHEIAQTYEEHLSQLDNAFVAWVQALSENPHDERTIREIERLAGSNGDRWNEALTTLSEAVHHAAGDPAITTRLYVLMGGWYGDKLARPDFALPCYSQALALDPANEAALDGTIALYRKAQAWADLVTILLRRADAAASAAKGRDARVDAAEILAHKLNDTSRAIDLFQKVVAEDPVHPRATAALEDLYGREKKWGDLVKLLHTKAENQRGADRTETFAAIAEVYEDRLQQPDKAQASYEQVLAIDARHVGALKGLERLYAIKGSYPELLANLRTQVEISATPRQKIALLERIGGLLEEEFVDHEKAAAAFEELVVIEPGHEGANAALARLYRRLNRFDELAGTLDRHAKSTTDDARKIDLLLQAVKVLSVDVGAPERALTVCERILAIDSHHSGALETMAQLRAATGDADAALSATERLATNEKDPAKKAELWVRAGKLLEERGDKDRAIEKYKEALDADKRSLVAFAALRSIYGSRGDAHGAAELLMREIEATDGAISKAKLQVELGLLARERLTEPVRAKEAFQKALELDPTATQASRNLGEMTFAEGDFAAAVKYLEPLLTRTSEMGREEARNVSVLTGDAFRKLSVFDKAQRAYLNAKAFAPDDRDVLERVADVTFDAGEADEAAELYRDLLKRFEAKLDTADRGRIHFRVGEASRRANDLDAAIKDLSKAAELMPGDDGALDALQKVYEQQNAWEEVVRTLKRRIEIAADDVRFGFMVRTGDILAEKLTDKGRATKAYVQALEFRADDRNLLTKLMALYSESKDWGRLVEVILRIAELVTEPKQLGKYYQTAAAISQTELKRLEEAADYYEQALEHDKTLSKSFDGLVECVTGLADWHRLEEVYRGQLRRLEESGTAEQKAHLWDALAELLLHRLDQQAAAVECYEEAQKLDPEDRRRAEHLAEIYQSDPKRWFQKAVRQHALLLEKSPYRVESYQALRRLYTDMKKPDESWCVCQALRALKQAEPDEESFFKKHRTNQPATAKTSFDDETWLKQLTHADQDPLLTAIFAMLEPAAIATRSQPLTAFGVDAGQKRQAATDKATMSQMLHYAGGVIAVPPPDLFYLPNDSGGLSFLFAQPPAIGLGKGALADLPPKALAFVAGRHLAFLRPGHYIRHLVPTGGGLRAWLLAAIKCTTPQFPVPGDLAGQVDEHLAAVKKHLPPPQQEHLKSLVQKLLAAAPELNLKRWVGAVDLTADRVGFVLANDLQMATAVIDQSADNISGVAKKDRSKELFLYSVSETYLTLRYKLGISIGE